MQSDALTSIVFFILCPVSVDILLNLTTESGKYLPECKHILVIVRGGGRMGGGWDTVTLYFTLKSDFLSLLLWRLFSQAS